MLRFNCHECGNEIEVPQDSLQPFIKCRECGSHEKVPLPSGNAPKYKVLDAKERARVELGTVPFETPEFVEESEPVEKPASGPVIAAPALASKKTPAGWPSKTPDYKKVKKPLDARKFLVDALGQGGMEMVLQMVASYLSEADEGKRRARKAKVIQTLMKSKVSGEMAAQAVEFAEKSPETREILLGNYKSSFYLGLGIFGVGLGLSLLVHFIAHPGPGFFIFQVPFAVGFAYAMNSAINILEIHYERLRSDLLHYAFMTLATILIAAYVVWGIYY